MSVYPHFQHGLSEIYSGGITPILEMYVGAVVEEFRKLLRLLELEYENSERKVVLTRDVQKLALPGQSFENLRKGAVLTISRWAATRLNEAGIAEPAEKTLDHKSLVQLGWKEKNNPGELQEVPRYLYLSIKEEAKLDPALKGMVMDLISLRIRKIMSLAAKRADIDVAGSLSREEEVLYAVVKAIVDEWLRHVSPSGGG